MPFAFFFVNKAKGKTGPYLPKQGENACEVVNEDGEWLTGGNEWREGILALIRRAICFNASKQSIGKYFSRRRNQRRDLTLSTFDSKTYFDISMNLIRRWARLWVSASLIFAISLSACAIASDAAAQEIPPCGSDTAVPASPEKGKHVTEPESTLSTNELVAMVKRPTTPTMMLENIKFALDHHLLLRDDFYSEEYLEHFFGAAKVRWANTVAPNKWGILEDFGTMFGHRFYRWGPVNESVGTFHLGRDANGKAAVLVRLAPFNGAHLRPKDFQMIFGSKFCQRPWKWTSYVSPHLADLPYPYVMDDVDDEQRVMVEVSEGGIAYEVSIVDHQE